MCRPVFWFDVSVVRFVAGAAAEIVREISPIHNVRMRSPNSPEHGQPLYRIQTCVCANSIPRPAQFQTAERLANAGPIRRLRALDRTNRLTVRMVRAKPVAIVVGDSAQRAAQLCRSSPISEPPQPPTTRAPVKWPEKECRRRTSSAIVSAIERSSFRRRLCVTPLATSSRTVASASPSNNRTLSHKLESGASFVCRRPIQLRPIQLRAATTANNAATGRERSRWPAGRKSKVRYAESVAICAIRARDVPKSICHSALAISIGPL